MLFLPDLTYPLGSAPVGEQKAPVKEVATTLLPPNATAYEVLLAKTLAARFDIATDIDSLWDPMRCPADFLPYLAWAENVDIWDSSWPIEIQRRVIDRTLANHRIKGTTAAVRQALDAVGITARVVEWHEKDPQGEEGTFEVQLLLRDDIETESPEIIDPDRVRAATQLIDRVKRLSAHYTFTTGVEASFSGQLAMASRLENSFAQTGELIYTNVGNCAFAFAFSSQFTTTFFQEGEL